MIETMAEKRYSNRIRRSTRAAAMDADQARTLATWAWFRGGHFSFAQWKHTDIGEALTRCGFEDEKRNLSIELRADLWRTLRQEKRSLGDNPMTVTTTAGGYLIPGDGFHDRFEIALLSTCPFLEWADVVVSNKNPHSFPLVDDTANVGRVSTINEARGEGSAVVAGILPLGGHWLSSDLLFVPYELVEDATQFIHTIPDLLGSRIGRLIGTLCTTGTGTGEPAGILTGATLGVTSQSATNPTDDELVSLVHSVDAAYRRDMMRPAWMMHDNTLLNLRSRRDGEGRHLWPSLQSSTPMLLGYPVIINNAFDSSITAESKPILFGSMLAFKVHIIGNDAEVTRVVPSATTRGADVRMLLDQEVFQGYLRLDSGVADPGTHPIKYLQMHA